jgi:hypothetical protein
MLTALSQRRPAKSNANCNIGGSEYLKERNGVSGGSIYSRYEWGLLNTRGPIGGGISPPRLSNLMIVFWIASSALNPYLGERLAAVQAETSRTDQIGLSQLDTRRHFGDRSLLMPRQHLQLATAAILMEDSGPTAASIILFQLPACLEAGGYSGTAVQLNCSQLSASHENRSSSAGYSSGLEDMAVQAEAL